MSSVQNPTYLPPPNWTFRPGGPIALGNIVADPFRPHRVLTKPTETLPETDTATEKDWRLATEKVRNINVSIWARLLEKAHVKLGAHSENSRSGKFTVKSLETTYFKDEPSIKEISERAKDQRIRNIIKTDSVFRSPVYMVTGLKIAKGFQLTHEDLDLSRSGIGLRKHLDRTWIEQRLYQLEEIHQLDASTNVSALARQVFQSHESEDTCAAIILLGELDYCLPIMHTPPFPSLPRIPRETEIYQTKKEISGPLWSRKYLGAFTTKPLPTGIVSRTGNPPANPRIISTNTPMLYRRTRVVHERSPPPSSGIKRRKNSTGSLVEMEIAPHAPPDVALNWLDTNGNSSIMSI